MIEVKQILAKHYNQDKDEDGNSCYYDWQIIDFAKDLVKQTLKEAAKKGNASINMDRGAYIEGNVWAEIDKSSITSIINNINFD